MRPSQRLLAAMDDLAERLQNIEHQAELMKTVLIVREPQTGFAAEAYEGLRKQVVVATSERMSHLNQVVQMAVAVRRAASVEELEVQVGQWIKDAGIEQFMSVPHGGTFSDFFEAIDGDRHDPAGLEIIEPAYYDPQSRRLLRLGRARPKAIAVVTDAAAEDTLASERNASAETSSDVERPAARDDEEVKPTTGQVETDSERTA